MDQPWPALTPIIPMLYTFQEAGHEDWLEAAPQQQRTAYGKCPETMMSSEANMHFHRLSPLLHLCVCGSVTSEENQHTHSCHMLHHLQAVLSCTARKWLHEWFAHVYWMNYTSTSCSLVISFCTGAASIRPLIKGWLKAICREMISVDNCVPPLC